MLNRPYFSLTTGDSGKFLLPFVEARTICRGALRQEQQRCNSTPGSPPTGPIASVVVAFTSVLHGPYLNDHYVL